MSEPALEQATGPRLTAADILRLWERGDDAPAAYRAALLADAARPAGVAGVRSLGERDRDLAELRRRTFGETADATVRCPACDRRLAIALALADLGFAPADGSPVRGSEEFELTVDGLTVRARTIDEEALTRAASCADVDAARAALLHWSVLEARRGDEPVPVENLSDAVVDAVGEAALAHDPLAEQALELTCAACGHAWTALFDIAAFTWVELDAFARRLVDEVHVLATAYGWTEGEILALSARRRHVYVERAGR